MMRAFVHVTQRDSFPIGVPPYTLRKLISLLSILSSIRCGVCGLKGRRGFCRGTGDRVRRSATELRHPVLAMTAGFEPATSRLTVDVTHVFTTGKALLFNS